MGFDLLNHIQCSWGTPKSTVNTPSSSMLPFCLSVSGALVHLRRLPATFACFPAHWNGLPELTGGDQWKSTLSPISVSSPGRCPIDCSKQISERAKICSPKVRICDPVFRFVPFSQVPKLHHLTVTANKGTMAATATAAPSTNLSVSFLVYKQDAQ